MKEYQEIIQDEMEEHQINNDKPNKREVNSNTINKERYIVYKKATKTI